MIRISWSALIGLAILILLLPLKWLLCALLAAIVHEAAHILSLTALGGRIDAIEIRASGTVICAWIPDKKREILSILAGPAGSFLMLLFHRPFPELSVCGGIQGLFNLLPFYPLDGGRVLHLLSSKHPRILITVILIAETFLLNMISIHLSVIPDRQHLLLLAAGILWALLRNTPCKEEQIGLQ